MRNGSRTNSVVKTQTSQNQISKKAIVKALYNAGQAIRTNPFIVNGCHSLAVNADGIKASFDSPDACQFQVTGLIAKLMLDELIKLDNHYDKNRDYKSTPAWAPAEAPLVAISQLENTFRDLMQDRVGNRTLSNYCNHLFTTHTKDAAPREKPKHIKLANALTYFGSLVSEDYRANGPAYQSMKAAYRIKGYLLL